MPGVQALCSGEVKDLIDFLWKEAIKVFIHEAAERKETAPGVQDQGRRRKTSMDFLLSLIAFLISIVALLLVFAK